MILESQHEVVGIADDNHFAPCPALSPLVHPKVEHVVQVDIRQQGRDDAANNLAKNWISFDIVIPRSRLKSIRGQGPDFEVQVNKEVTSTQSVGGDVHGRKKPKKRKDDSGPA